MSFARSRCQLWAGGGARSLAVQMTPTAPAVSARRGSALRCVQYSFPQRTRCQVVRIVLA